jgi:hypothetical protein
MTKFKDLIIKNIEQKARLRVAELSVAFARAKSEDREEILAEMEFQRELADMCDFCLG